jgi:Methyltransferase domain
MAFAHNAKGRLTARDVGRFPTGRLFDRLGRAVCEAGCLPRKELYEAWEVARRVRRLFRGGRVVDLCGGHGLLAHVMLLLDDSSASAIVVDTSIPPSSTKLSRALIGAWPRLAERVVFMTAAVEDVPLDPLDIVVSSHACGTLTDRVLDRAAVARARVAVLPCCHDLGTPDASLLDGWMDGALAIDAQRAIRLASRGYRVRPQAIPASITPKNRLLIGEPTMSVSD